MKLWVRLTLLFMVLGIAPLLILGHFAYRRGQGALLSEAESHLSSVAVLKEDALLEWIEGNTALLESVAARPLVAELSLQLANAPRGTPGWVAAHERLTDSHLVPNIMAGIEDLSVLHSESGQILASTDRILEGRFRESEDFYVRGRIETYVDHVRYVVTAESLTLHLSTPIRTASGELAAVLSAHVDLEEMGRIVRLTSGSHDSQDIYLINDAALFVTEPKFGEGYALRRMLNTEGAHAVTAGASGVAQYVDYRNIDVLGAYRWIDSLSMGLLVETDRSEILQPMRTLGLAVVVGEVIAAVVVLLFAVLFSRGIVRPVHKLKAGADEIGRGNLAFKIETHGPHEIAQLGQAFNRMTENLRQITASRDELDREVQARTAAELRLHETIRALEQSESKFRLLADASPIGVFIFKDMVLQYTNPAFDEIFGYSNEELVQKLGPLEITHPDDHELAREYIGKCFAQVPDLPPCLFRGVRKDGSEVICEARGRPVEYADGVALLGALADVTVRHEAERAIGRAKEITDSIIESLPGVFYQISPEGRFVRWNHAFASATGYTDEEMLQISPLDLFRGEDKERVGREIQRVFDDGQSSVAAAFVAKDGGSSPYYFTGLRMVIDGIPYVVGMGTDISDLKAVEGQLRQSMEELERSNEELERFAYVASHDLQEPLRMVASYTQLLERRYHDALDEDAKDFIRFAVDGASRMQRLINDLLAFSRVQTRGKEFEPVEMGLALKHACDNLGTAIEESDAEVTYDDGLPVVQADETQLVSVLQNLVANAIKFRSDVRPRVHIGVKDRGIDWEFSVRDNGIGISPDFFDRIFVIFQRLHTRDEYPGTGIGLALCKRIIERHGGQISVESQQGQGSTFRFTLPKEHAKEVV